MQLLSLTKILWNSHYKNREFISAYKSYLLSVSFRISSSTVTQQVFWSLSLEKNNFLKYSYNESRKYCKIPFTKKKMNLFACEDFYKISVRQGSYYSLFLKFASYSESRKILLTKEKVHHCLALCDFFLWAHF